MAEQRQNMPEVGGSIPQPRIRFTHEKLGLSECPYMHRWVLDFGVFAIRLHRWFSSDDARAFHDHPWWFLTLVLWGGYTDVSPEGRDALGVGSVRFRPAHHKHTVEISRPTWTLLVTGPPARRWGFWIDGKLRKRDKYFATHGHHPCVPAGLPVRMRPSGERIEGGN